MKTRMMANKRETLGLLLYWRHRVTNYASKIQTKYRVDFEKDILEIASPEFETNQKLGTLHGLYRAYPFLGTGKN